jgi:type IV secretory pathway VirB3-like protein
MYALNENYAQLVIHKDNNMRKEHHASLETTDSMLTKIFWMGNLTCSQRRRQGKLEDIQVA